MGSKTGGRSADPVCNERAWARPDGKFFLPPKSSKQGLLLMMACNHNWERWSEGNVEYIPKQAYPPRRQELQDVVGPNGSPGYRLAAELGQYHHEHAAQVGC